jgi:acyl carrier protein
MEDFLNKIAGILEVPAVSASDDLKSYAQWDSLAALSVIAMLDASYGLNLSAAEIQKTANVGELWDLVQARKRM